MFDDPENTSHYCLGCERQISLTEYKKGGLWRVTFENLSTHEENTKESYRCPYPDCGCYLEFHPFLHRIIDQTFLGYI
jgi:hypothetical protein